MKHFASVLFMVVAAVVLIHLAVANFGIRYDSGV